MFWIQPAGGDDGLVESAALYTAWIEILSKRRSFFMDHSYVGKPYK